MRAKKRTKLLFKFKRRKTERERREESAPDPGRSRTVFLRIKSLPSGAKVYKGRRYMGRTPLTIWVEASVYYKIKLVKPCYKTYTWRWYASGNLIRKVRLLKDTSKPCKKSASLAPHHRVTHKACNPPRRDRNWKQRWLRTTGKRLDATSMDRKKRWLRTHRRRVAQTPLANSIPLDKIIELAEAHVKADPMSWDKHKRLLYLYTEGKRHKDALKAIQRWRRYAPDNTMLIKRESNLLRILGQYEESLRVFSELVEFAPHNYQRRMMYAHRLEKLGNISGSCQEYASTVRLNPSRRNTFRTMMSLYRKRQKNREYRDIVRSCITQGVSRLPVVRDISMVMFWDDPSADIDLHIHEPTGDHVYYSKRESSQGGTLYYDITNGLGPEIYVLGSGKPGKYRISAVYFSGRPAVIRGTLIVMKNAGSPKEMRKVYRFKLRKYPRKKPHFITSITLKTPQK